MLERVPRMTPCKREYLHDRSTEGGLEAIISVVFKATFCQARARGFIPRSGNQAQQNQIIFPAYL